MRRTLFMLLLTAVLCAGCSPGETTPEVETLAHPSPGQTASELIIIYDNNPSDSRLYTAWGFSCLVRLPQKTILFDTGGDSSTLLHNMTQLQIDPEEIDIVVLSHIHGDHVGGLSGFLEENNAVTVYMLKSFPRSFKDEVKSLGAEVEEISAARELLPGVYTTGELGNGTREQSLIITSSKGLVIITGCAHPGVVNIIQIVKGIVPDDRVYLAMGGFHLSGASSVRLESIIEKFIQLSVEKVALCHCSGDEARRLFKERYGNDYIESGVGKRIPLP
ncbi:Ribonuclease BN [subsurface metagenome]